MRTSTRLQMLRWGALVWALLLLILLASLIPRLQQDGLFDTSIMALLPEQQQSPLQAQISQNLAERAGQRLLLVWSAPEPAVADRLGRWLANQLQSFADITNLVWRPDTEQQAHWERLRVSHPLARLNPGAQAALRDGDYETIVRQALARWLSPTGLSAGELLVDPFNLTDVTRAVVPGSVRVMPDNGLLRAVNLPGASYLMLAELGGDPFDLHLQRRLRAGLDALERHLEMDGVSLQVAGLLVHAEAGARQAQNEISTVGLGSLSGIVLLLWWVFRSARPLLLVLLSVAVGCLVASAVTLLVFDRIHLVTIAFGAGLVGVSVDYGLHLLCASWEKDDPDASLRSLLPGLGLGLFSSLLAYAALALAPFPGLRQMALFCCSGLLGSWLTVALWLPQMLRPRQPTLAAPRRLTLVLDAVLSCMPSRMGRLLLAVTVVALAGLFLMDTEDDIRLLQTSPAALLSQEREIYKALELTSGSTYLLVQAADLQGLLEREEAMRALLDQLVASGQLASYTAISQVLPSLARQQAQMAQIDALYQAQLPGLLNRIGLDAGLEHRIQQQLRQQIGNPLVAEQWLESAALAPYRHLLINTGKQWGSITLVAGLSHEGRDELVEALTVYPDTVLVDRVSELSSLLASYRQQISGWLLAAYALVALVLLIRYRWRAWMIIVPPALASGLTLSLLSMVTGGVNLFHILALLLVLGIGIDMGIFLRESRYSAHTWLAVSLSVVTSLLAFGLLALSATPVLHHFGFTVLLGLSLSWLLALLVSQGSRTRGAVRC